MSRPVLRVAVVGHTNTGKTSLLRTLTRDEEFGEVSPRPAVTREVSGTSLIIDGEPLVELYDTPGLEDSIGLLDHLDDLRGDRRADGIEYIGRFLESEEARSRFAQEAKALRQVLACDVALYAIDVRDRVLGKHRDELEILGRCAKPVVPVLNFIASEDAQTSLWREHLSRVNMHAVAEFDTVVYNDQDEQRLYEKMRTLLDSHRETIDALTRLRRRQREELIDASARLLAELLIDAAAFVMSVPLADRQRAAETVEAMKRKVRDREQRCVRELLELHRFRPEDCEAQGLPVTDGRWGLDLFSPEAMKQLGLKSGGAAAAGAAVGLTLDVMLAGLSLGTGTAIGAAIGALIGSGRMHGRRLLDRAMGMTELRCDDATLSLLRVRQTALIRALLRRGHATQDPMRLEAGEKAALSDRSLSVVLREARVHPAWSRLSAGPVATHPSPHLPETTREGAVNRLARLLRPKLR
ncbi:MAG: GTPase/DUF3482 domain-containing protein [Phycisphaerales bacterium]|nr:MAG: GTPase/DUF3482 domain-containing protein [Phycisphaerales bacterium]